MNELQRQAWLKAMDLTPWVARRALPGAAPSPELAWPEQAPARVEPAAQADVAAESSPDTPAPRTSPLRHSETSRPAEPAPRQPASATTAGGLRVTVQAYQAGKVWVLAEQSDPGAPDLGRDALRLLHNLLKVFPGGGSQRRFVWPLSGLAADDAAAGPTFLSFVQALGSVEEGARVLLCAREETVRALAGAGRFDPLPAGNAVLLPVASLEEMLADPVVHKRQSWQAMVRAGFNG